MKIKDIILEDYSWENEYNSAYDVLGIPQNASYEQVKTAYRKLISKYHPDRNTDADASTKAKHVNDAKKAIDDGKPYGSKKNSNYQNDFRDRENSNQRSKEQTNRNSSEKPNKDVLIKNIINYLVNTNYGGIFSSEKPPRRRDWWHMVIKDLALSGSELGYSLRQLSRFDSYVISEIASIVQQYFVNNWIKHSTNPNTERNFRRGEEARRAREQARAKEEKKQEEIKKARERAYYEYTQLMEKESIRAYNLGKEGKKFSPSSELENNIFYIQSNNPGSWDVPNARQILDKQYQKGKRDRKLEEELKIISILKSFTPEMMYNAGFESGKRNKNSSNPIPDSQNPKIQSLRAHWQNGFKKALQSK